VEERVSEADATEELLEAAVSGSVADNSAVASALDDSRVQESQRRNILLISAIKPENDLDRTLREVTTKLIQESGNSLSVRDVFDRAAPDYEVERENLLGADLLIFHYRPILNSPPALLKSWLEGALIQGDGTPVEEVALQGRKAVLLVTCADNVTDDVTAEKLPFISSIQDSVLRSYDMDVQKAFIVFQAGPDLADDVRAARVGEWINRLSTIINL